MSVLSFQCLVPNHPLVDVLIVPSPHTQFIPGSTPAKSVKATMLLDTGSSHCLIDGDVLLPLQMIPHSSAPVRSAVSGPKPVTRPTFAVTLELLEQPPGAGSWLTGPLSLTAAVPGAFIGHYQGVIGMNVLRRAVLTYDGPGQRFTIDC